jgi:hypothetical protein
LSTDSFNADRFADLQLERRKEKKSVVMENLFSDHLPDENESRAAKIWNHMRKSSLFIFHEKWKIRQFLLTLILSADNLIPRDKIIKDAKEFGIKDLSSSYVLPKLSIVEGKIVTDK